MQQTQDAQAAQFFLAEGGDMGALIRRHDWGATPLGLPAAWPQPLRTLVGVMLASAQPMFIAWGPEHILLYNDSYVPMLADRHPDALGQPFLAVWAEAAADLAPLVDQVFAGEPVHMNDIELYLDRPGRPREAHFAFSYTPVRDEAGAVVGLFCPCIETTDQVLAERTRRQDAERQRALLQQMPGFVAVLSGPEHRYEYVNDAYVEISGDRVFAGRTVREVFPEIAGQGFYELLDRVYATGEPFVARDMPISLDREDGERFIDLLYEPIRDDGGQVTGIFVGGYDVTERVRAERRREVLATLDERLLDIHEPGAMALASAEVLGTALGACRVGYGEIDPQARTVAVARAWSMPDLPDVAGTHRFADYGKHIEDLLHGDAVAVADVATDPRVAHAADAFRALGIAAHLDVPVVEDDRVVAEMFVHASAPRAWTEGEVALTRDVALRTRAAITRRQAEAALRENETRLRAVQDAAVDGFMLLDSVRDAGGAIIDFRWADANAAAERIIGKPPVWFTGRLMLEAMPGNRDEGLFDTYVRVVETGEPWTGEFAYCRDGVEVFLRAVAAKADDGFAISFADLSERRRMEARLRESEERYRRLFEIIDEGFCVIEFIDGPHGPMSDYVHKEANPAYRRHTGIDEIVGKTGREELTEAEADEWVAIFRHTLETGAPQRFERAFEAQGRYLEVACFCIEPASKRQVAIIFQDITARKRAEAALRELNETLESRVAARTAELQHTQDALRQSQKLEAMGQLTGGVAHDFNNLLTPIIGSLDMLRRRGLGGEREQRMIDAGLKSAERAKLLVQRLLAFARRQPLQATTVDVGALVRGMADLVASTTGPQVTVNISIAEDLPPALADANQIEMAILNLAVNARDAMPDGGGITLAATAEEAGKARNAPKLPAGRYVRLSVIDTGIGMDEETRARAIEPFFSTKGIGRGTGLGLSMVHGLAAQSGGALDIISTPGLGTRIDLWLPVAGAAPMLVQREEVANAAGASGTALLVDDEELARLSTADMLADMGYAVVEADTAEAAMRLIGDGLRPDLLVTDHLMPGMTGAELAQHLQSRMAGLQVLLVSGYADAEGVPPGVPRLTKPFTHAELSAAVAALAPAAS